MCWYKTKCECLVLTYHHSFQCSEQSMAWQCLKQALIMKTILLVQENQRKLPQLFTAWDGGPKNWGPGLLPHYPCDWSSIGYSLDWSRNASYHPYTSRPARQMVTVNIIISNTLVGKFQLQKPKFHYADFATFTETSPRGKSRTQILKVCNTNRVADFHDLCPWQSPPTFSMYCNELNSIRTTQMGLSRTCRKLCRKMVRVCNFHDLFWWLSLKHHDFMICHRLCPRLS